MRYVSRDAKPFLKEEIDCVTTSTENDTLRNFAVMLEGFYRTKIERYDGQGQYDFSLEEIVEAIRKTIQLNYHEEMTLFIYNCQNTNIANVPEATLHSGIFIQICHNIATKLLVAKGKAKNSGLLTQDKFLKQRKRIED